MYSQNHFNVTKLLLIIATLLVMLAFLSMTVFAQSWEELPERGTTVDFTGIFNKEATSIGGRAIYARDKVWFGVQGSQITGDSKILSQDAAARVQGGADVFWGLNAQGFIEANRDMDTDFTLSTGAYLRMVFDAERTKIVLGAGSLVERDDVRTEIGLDATDPTVLPYWLAIAGMEYNFSETVDIYGKLVGKPEIGLTAFEGILDIGVDIVLSEKLTLKLQSTSEIAIANEADAKVKLSDIENSVLLSINY